MTHHFMLKGGRILLVDDAAICRQSVLCPLEQHFGVRHGRAEGIALDDGRPAIVALSEKVAHLNVDQRASLVTAALGLASDDYSSTAQAIHGNGKERHGRLAPCPPHPCACCRSSRR